MHEFWSSEAVCKAIVTFDDSETPEGETPFVAGTEAKRTVAIEPYNPDWASVYRKLEAVVRQVLGPKAIAVEHVGSTSVPGLAAKPIIDIDLTVADANTESAYLPALERAGFTLAIREPWWYEHRMMTMETTACHLHIWSIGSPEAVRHLIFRNWLRGNEPDRQMYERAKTEAAEGMSHEPGLVSVYNARKQTVIRQIYAKAFAALGLSE